MKKYNLNLKSIFDQRELFVATMHGKEKVIGTKMKEAFGISSCIDKEFNTDEFGTFSGEIERLVSPYESAIKKCELAHEKFSYDLVIASEGSFYMTFGFVSTNHEFILLKDFKNDLEIKADFVTHDTNFNGQLFNGVEGLEDFLDKCKFPSHALILRPKSDSFERMDKGVNNIVHLERLMQSYLNEFGSVYLETDMRAMFNPTRMLSISSATDKLVSKMKSNCPDCSVPGFGIKRVEDGLPCELCLAPTKGVKKHIYECDKCSFSNEILYPNKKSFQDPMYCDVCNP